MPKLNIFHLFITTPWLGNCRDKAKTLTFCSSAQTFSVSWLLYGWHGGVFGFLMGIWYLSISILYRAIIIWYTISIFHKCIRNFICISVCLELVSKWVYKFTKYSIFLLLAKMKFNKNESLSSVLKTNDSIKFISNILSWSMFSGLPHCSNRYITKVRWRSRGSKLKEKKIKDKIMAMPTTLGLNWGFVETNWMLSSEV